MIFRFEATVWQKGRWTYATGVKLPSYFAARCSRTPVDTGADIPLGFARACLRQRRTLRHAAACAQHPTFNVDIALNAFTDVFARDALLSKYRL